MSTGYFPTNQFLRYIIPILPLRVGEHTRPPRRRVRDADKQRVPCAHRGKIGLVIPPEETAKELTL